MIKIKLSDEKIKDLQDKHWNWFKKSCLPNILNVKKEIDNKKISSEQFTNINNHLVDLNKFFNYLFTDITNNKILNIQSDTNLKGTNLYYLIIGKIQEDNYRLREKSLMNIIDEVDNLFPSLRKKILDEQKKKEKDRVLIPFFSSLFDYENKLDDSFKFLLKNHIFYDSCNDFIDKITKLDLRISLDKDKKNRLINDLSTKTKVDLSELLIINNKETLKKKVNDIIKSNISNLKKDFSYIKYIEHFPSTWSKYHLVYEVGITTCPYCNRSYIHPYYYENNNTAKTRGDLDHFLPKSKYPFLAVSLFNLVPCCKVCNSSFKNTKEMSYDTHLNPYEGGIEDIVKFTLEPISSDVYQGYSLDFNISYIKIPEADEKIFEKAKGNLELFKIKELYNFHKDYIKELITKAKIYNKEYVDELWNEYQNTLFDSRSEVVQMIISNYIDDTNLDKRILAKLTKDISQELGLLDL